MSHPDVNGDSSDGPTRAWGDTSSDETQVVRPQSGNPSSIGAGSTPIKPRYGEAADGSQPETGSGTQTSAPSVEAPVGGSNPGSDGAEQGGWATYPDRSAYSSESTMTSVYPQVAPGYAPAGHSPAYAPATAVSPTPPVAAEPERTSNRVGPAFICILAGILLTAGGMLLAGKYGIVAESNLTHNSVVIKNSGLTTLGAILLLAAVLLNGWSPWATVIPGIVLTAVGGWALYDTSATVRVGRWTSSVLTTNQLAIWHHYGVTLAIGLMMLAASAAAAIARASGKRDGKILGRRQIS